MKKLMTIFGAFMFASFVLTSCGGPESDAQSDADCMCKAMNMEDQVKAKEAYDKCEEAADKNLAKYKEEGEEAEKKYDDAGRKAMEECEEEMKKGK